MRPAPTNERLMAAPAVAPELPCELGGVRLEPHDFDPAPPAADSVAELAEDEPVWRRRLAVFCSSRVAVLAVVLLLAVALFGFLGPLFTSASYDQVFRGEEKLAPTAAHLLGTDEMGRDMLVRCMYGVRISLSVGLITAVAVLVIGCAYGSVAGYCGGRVDMVLMRIVEVIESLPAQLVVLLMAISLKAPVDALFAALPQSFVTEAGSGMFCILVAFVLLYWTGLARIVRGSVLQLKGEGYAMAARSMGAKGPSVVWNHLLPNSLSLIVVQITQLIKDAIFAEAFLSFIGMGVSVPMASLGTLINNARQGMVLYPYLMIEPVVLIFVITWALYVIGDALEDAFDPKML